MYQFKPTRKNARARVLVLSLFAAAAACFVLASQLERLSVIPQSVGLVLLLPAIQLLSRFVVTQYLYRITPREGHAPDLEIFAYRGGSKMQLVCRVGLDEITALADLTDENRKPPRAVRRHNYCVDLAPPDAVVLSIKNGDGECELLLTPDATMRAMLKQ